MNNVDSNSDLINRIIENESIITFFQPIITVKSKKIIIFEALSRGIDLQDNSIIPPAILFQEAKKNNLTEVLDLICIKKTLKTFNEIKLNYEEILLSINISVSSIVNNIEQDWLYDLTKQYDISPSRIILEVLEDTRTDIKILQEFVKFQKNRGFLIALDDIGSGYSGLVRMSKLKPDIIKIDRSLITAIDSKRNNQQIVRSLTELGHRLGILIIAEGIETSTEAIKLVEIGIDLQQGFYFSKPGLNIDKLFNESINKIIKISIVYKSHIQRYIKILDDLDKDRINKIDKIISIIEKEKIDNIPEILLEIANNNKTIELFYILDNNGIMVTDTLGIDKNKIKTNSYIFKPAHKGEDFSLKDYFMHVKGKKEHYHSAPYISRATGVECVTFSKCFTTIDNKEYILCVDLMSLDSLFNLED